MEQRRRPPASKIRQPVVGGPHPIRLFMAASQSLCAVCLNAQGTWSVR
jgi:hypothetical protein